ncbi:Putative major facilitator superfamily, MFS transporter superfamily [Septoria linicola]|uniref:Major facilitator superfamily, MFS transporter superfamily n=1 Tax=Septoria linicola TaxID=215465 RepID=A0A9Q9AGD5_9PEZI|nr:Putative major facilitator superfamily, MFS transporter superfamily [Septoria linicola]
MRDDSDEHVELQKLDRESLEEHAEETITRRNSLGDMARVDREHERHERQPLTRSDSGKGTGSGGEKSNELTRRTVRKLDTILLPFLALLFLLNSLDKSNIGNAETAGFTYDTGLSRQDVHTSMGIFFFVFVLLQPLGAACGRRFGMRRFVPACMSLWGLSTILHIFVRKRWHLILLRIMIAILEAGFYPTTVSYMSLFYTKFEFATRLGFFYGMTAVAGVVGGVLSWAVFSQFPGHEDGPNAPDVPPSVQSASGSAGWKSWEVLFLVEGCLTMTVALIGFLWLPRSADSAWFLNAEERAWAESRMRSDTYPHDLKTERSDDDMNNSVLRHDYDANARVLGIEQDNATDEAHERLLDEEDPMRSPHRGRRKSTISAISVTRDSGLSRHDIVSAFFNYKIWHLLICNVLSAIPATAFGVLLPILVKELSPSLNLSPAASNLLSAPPFAFGAIVLFIFVAWSDRAQLRLVPIIWGLLLLLIGLTLTVLAPIENYWLRYFSLCVLLSGSFIASPLTVAWLANNTPEAGKRAILLGINGWGNLAGVFMSVLFTPEDKDTGYIRSFSVLLVCVLMSLAGFAAFRFLVVRENKWRHDLLRSWSDEEKEREDLLGDVPAPDDYRMRIARSTGLLYLARRLGLEEGRKGDERLTFRYGL